MTSSNDRFDVGEFISKGRLGGFHVLIVVLVTIVMMVDGYDLLFIGTVLPAVSKGLGVPANGLTSALTLQAAAIAVGGLLLSTVSDKFGRKTILLLSVFGFGAATIASGLCTDATQFAVTRAIAGFFLGGVVPNAIPIVSEYAPAKYKGTLVTLSYAGFSLGGILGALISTRLASHYSWQSAFLVAGAAPMVVALVCLFALPESVAFLVLRNPADPKIPAVLRRLDPRLKLKGGEVFHVDDKTSKRQTSGTRLSVLDLFSEGRTVTTLCAWGLFGLSLSSSGLATVWSATILVNKHGLTLVQAGQYTALLTFSSIIGILFYGRLLDRFGYTRVLIISYLLAIASMLSLAAAPWDSGIRVAATVINGLTALTAQSGLVALVPLLYPARMKTTGLGWAWSLGRGMAMTAPLIGGYLIGHDISFFGYLVAVSIPWAGMVVLLLILARERRRAAKAA